MLSESDADDEGTVFVDKRVQMAKTARGSGGSGGKTASGSGGSGGKKSSERKLYHSKIYKQTLKAARCAGKSEEEAKAKARKRSSMACQKRFGS